jgi:tRNA modification GTPase
MWLGKLGEDGADQVVVLAKECEPIPYVEIHCHGGREIVRLLEEIFVSRGAQRCSWLEFEKSGETSSVHKAAAQALANSLTVRTASLLLDQYSGAFENAITAVLSALDGGETSQVTGLLATLARYAPLGKHLAIPWRVAIAGAPNVGKSSLVNALAGYERCVVSEIPGTTRDLVTTLIAVGGWPVELIDTAGLRSSDSGLELQGIELARRAVEAADLCLWVVEASAPPIWPPSVAEPMQIVINKIDSTPQWDLDRQPAAVRVSALTGTGIPELAQSIAQWLVPEVPPPGAAIPFTPSLCRRVEETYDHLVRGQLEQSRRILLSVCQEV